MILGIDRILDEVDLQLELKGKRLGLLANPAAVNSKLAHSLDTLMKCPNLRITAAYGPQHGMRGEKQDNMQESDDYIDPVYQIPVYSLYGNTRRPTDKMMEAFDHLVVDIQDVGTRVYTFITTLRYMLEACAKFKKGVWVLDRPNPAGRIIEGSKLDMKFESFVGLGPIPMRHGMTVGEIAGWIVHHFQLKLDLTVIAMRGYDPNRGPGYGWPSKELSWVNPSPNAGNPSMPKIYPGSVLIEGTTLSEGRGTTHPLETVGAPDISIRSVLTKMDQIATEWVNGCTIRTCFFEPTFHKHAGRLCEGFQIHVDHPSYVHNQFKPYRLFALFLKAIRVLYPNYQIWREFEYEYVKDTPAIDVISGSDFLRKWIDNTSSTPSALEEYLRRDEDAWIEERKAFLIY